MRVKESVHTDIFTWNRQVYHRLKLALSLNLRRQIFFAVCDDLQLRQHIVTRLNSTLAYPSRQTNTEETGITAYPRLVTLRLNLNDPNPLAQINQWLANYPPPVMGKTSDNPGRSLPIPAFQIVGVELLTKQPVAVQRLFLNYLRLSEHYFSNQQSAPFIESTLLLWLQRPWLHAIQQSAAKFWYCRTGMFIFAGEPKPTLVESEDSGKKSSSSSLDLANLELSNIKDTNISQEFEETIIQDFPADKHHSPQLQMPTVVSNKLSNEDIPATFVSTNNINQELNRLIKATSKGNEDGDEYWRATQQLEKIEHLQKSLASRNELAVAYQDLGNLYRLRIEQGESSLENLMVAIIAYQEAITQDNDLPDLPDILNDLGTLYWLLHRTPGSPESEQAYIEQGIEFYQLVINLISPETHTETYASTQSNLGTAYGDLAQFIQPVENWQKSIAAYHQAIRYRSKETEPLKYAACQNNLGTAYWHLAQHIQPVEYLREAIAAYNQALIYYKSAESPVKYGMIQNNIGTAYWNLAQYETPREHLQLAIIFYQEALRYRTPTNIPSAYAVTQNNIGTAYWHIANLAEVTPSEKRNFINLAIFAFKEATNMADKDISLNFDLIGTYNNLGLAHYQLVVDKYLNDNKKNISLNLESALKNHLQALKQLPNQSEAYQTTFNHLVKIIRTFYDELGIQGQNLALSQVPSQFIPYILSKL